MSARSSVGNRRAEEGSKEFGIAHSVPAVGVYVGEGASHSWTWFVDLLERYGYHRVSFLSEGDIRSGGNGFDILVVSGGDTFAVAGALGAQGAEAVRTFVSQGGLYIGSCAGAYLPLFSSKEPLHHFNFVKARINNLTSSLPPVVHLPDKFYSSYGCSYIVNPVRDEVCVRICEGFPAYGGKEIMVPLYGGPPLNPSDDVVPLAYYSGFTERSMFLTSPEIAEDMFLGKIAACEKRMGAGYFLLLGPHFEHPGFPQGNEVVAAWIEARHLGSPSMRSTHAAGEDQGRHDPCFTESLWHAFMRELSNARIKAWALERASLSWKIGAKTYEPEKILHFLEAIWKRRKGIRVHKNGKKHSGMAAALVEDASRCHSLITHIAQASARGEDGYAHAEALFPILKHLCAVFLAGYFQCTRLSTASVHEEHRIQGNNGSA